VQAIPVIGLTGYLGAGKTSLLNHVLRSPGARIGVIINDFGELNVDAMLVTGQVDEPVSIAGGCICCLPDDGGIDEALTRLTDPRLNLDAVIVEASGLAEPVAVARMIGFSGVAGVRFGGLVDVIDAATHFDTVDIGHTPPARYGAASLVVVNKLDQLPHSDRAATVERVEYRVRERNPRVTVVGAVGGQIDRGLLYDVAGTREEPGQLSLRELLVEATTDPTAHDHDHDHDHDNMHADSVTVTSVGEVDPGALIDLLENPPAGVYRLKGAVVMSRQSGRYDGSHCELTARGVTQLSGCDRDGPRHRCRTRPTEYRVVSVPRLGDSRQCSPLIRFRIKAKRPNGSTPKAPSGSTTN
jgi:G3E family GTPase